MLDFDREAIDCIIGGILERVKTDNVRATVTWEPGRIELTVEPYESYQVSCPYQKESKNGEEKQGV